MGEAIVRGDVSGVLTKGMTARGWHPSEQSNSGLTAVPERFYRSLRGGDPRFVATAQFHILDDERRPRRHGRSAADTAVGVDVELGVTAPEVERLLTALGARHRNAASEKDLRELSPTAPDTPVVVRGADDPGSVLLSLMAAVDELGNSLVDLATPEAWLEDLRSDPDERDFEVELVPVALVAFGRIEEARSALAQYGATVENARYQAFVTKLTHFIDSESTTPKALEDRGNTHADEPRTREIGVRERVDRRRAALSALERTGRGASPEVRIAALEDALAREGLQESPLWIESHALPRRRGLLSMVALGKDIAASAIKASRGGLPEDPPLLRPPRGVADLSGSPVSKWTAVVLDRGVDVLLAEVYRSAAQHFGDTVALKPWLRLEPAGDAVELATVAIGEQRVGTVGAADLSTPFAEALAGEVAGKGACVQGRLTRRSGWTHYLLEIAEPARC
jgi:hypothetical protein